MKAERKNRNKYNSRIQPAAKKMSSINRNKVYWISQITGWTVFVLLNIIVISFIEEMSWQRVVIWIYLGFAGISFTHILRGIIKNRNWLNLPLKKLIPRVLLSSFITGTLIYSFAFMAGYLSGATSYEEYTAIKPVAGIINLTSVTLFWMLIYFSINYFESYNKKEIESLIWEAAVKDYELKTLRSQLNPHFMFNAMNSIRALIEEDPESAKSALTKLSNILRYSLQMERMEKVSLEDEIDTVKNYLELESIRFEERLQYKLNIENGSSKVEIPPMMIQTLVENGIKHGISKIPKGGAISITTRVDNSKLYLEIRNSGNVNEDDLKNSNGFGVNNTKHRLNLLFGEEAKFSLQNEDEKNVLAKLEIPIGGTNQ